MKGPNGFLACQESYACGGTEQAEYECDECGSLQCARCELELHRQDRMRNHDRVRITEGHVPFCDPCKGDGGPGNGARHRAVIRCQGCKINLCLDCQKRTHSGVSKKKHPITAYPACKAVEKNANSGADEVQALLEKVSSFLLVNEKEEMQVFLFVLYKYCIYFTLWFTFWTCNDHSSMFNRYTSHVKHTQGQFGLRNLRLPAGFLDCRKNPEHPE